eukprot:scaffold35821_cov38-Prasinocladus_malaysianus.AAC.1
MLRLAIAVKGQLVAADDKCKCIHSSCRFLRGFYMPVVLLWPKRSLLAQICLLSEERLWKASFMARHLVNRHHWAMRPFCYGLRGFSWLNKTQQNTNNFTTVRRSVGVTDVRLWCAASRAHFGGRGDQGQQPEGPAGARAKTNHVDAAKTLK